MRSRYKYFTSVLVNGRIQNVINKKKKMILKINISERQYKETVWEQTQVVFVKVKAVQIENGNKKYFLEGENILKTNHWISTTNLALIQTKSKYKLYFECQYEQLKDNDGIEMILVDIGQEISVEAMEVDSFPSL
jgi:hypothetical protein